MLLGHCKRFKIAVHMASLPPPLPVLVPLLYCVLETTVGAIGSYHASALRLRRHAGQYIMTRRRVRRRAPSDWCVRQQTLPMTWTLSWSQTGICVCPALQHSHIFAHRV